MSSSSRYVIRKEFFGAIAWDSEKKDYFMLSDTDLDEVLRLNKFSTQNINIDNNYRIVSSEPAYDDILSFPLRIHLSFTEVCNTECKHCFSSVIPINSDYLERLGYEDIVSILEEMQKFGCMEIFVGGGEPFMRKDWFRIFKYAENIGIQLFIFTNGALLNDKNIRLLNSLNNIGYLSVSLEGYDADTYSQVRDARLWPKVKENLGVLGRISKFPAYIRYTATSTNIHKFKGLVSFIEEIGGGRIGIKVRPILPSGNAKNNSELLIGYKEYLEFLVKIKQEISSSVDIDVSIYKDADPRKRFYRFSRKTIGFSRFVPIYNGFGGSGGYTSLYIDPYGNIQDCVMTYNHFKSAHEDNVKYLGIYYQWQNATPILKKRQLVGNEECLDCDYYIWCRGGCRSRAIFWKGDENGKDPWCYKDLVLMCSPEELNGLLSQLNEG